MICVEEEIKEEETCSQKSKDGDTKRRRKREQGYPWKFLGSYELRLCPHKPYSQNLLFVPPSQLRCLLAVEALRFDRNVVLLLLSTLEFNFKLLQQLCCSRCCISLQLACN